MSWLIVMYLFFAGSEQVVVVAPMSDSSEMEEGGEGCSVVSRAIACPY